MLGASAKLRRSGLNQLVNVDVDFDGPRLSHVQLLVASLHESVRQSSRNIFLSMFFSLNSFFSI